MKADVQALLFAAKSFIAAMLAMYISLRLGLPKPYWAIGTAYIVSQTSAGASLSRGLYRLAGTACGAMATVVIVPNFSNEPIICSALLAGWIGLCLYLSLLDRTPRAYAFVLSGYTASLIGFPSVLAPSTVFDTASLRVQEIAIGILCAVLCHGFILPTSLKGAFQARVAAAIGDARELVEDALTGTLAGESRLDRHRLASDLLAIEGLGTHIAFDPTAISTQSRGVRQLHDRLVQLLPVTSEVEERLQLLRSYPASQTDEMDRLLEDTRRWVQQPDRNDPAPSDLIARANRLHLRYATAPADWEGLLTGNLAQHLSELVGLVRDCQLIHESLSRTGGSALAHLKQQPEITGYVFHRDHWMAARAALGCIVGVVLACLFWIHMAWSDGATAVSIMGVCCALFGSVDAPAATITKYLLGSIFAVAIGLFYSFVVLPTVTGFPSAVAVLAPAFLLIGSLQARPPTMIIALGMVLTFPIVSGLGAPSNPSFDTFLNSSLALLLGTGAAMVSVTFFQTVSVKKAIRRLLRAGRHDVALRAGGLRKAERQWASLMIDRAALLYPRLQKVPTSHRDVMDDTVRLLRIGHVASQLHATLRSFDPDLGLRLKLLLADVATLFRQNSDELRPSLIDRLDQMIPSIVPGPASRRVLDLLIDLRCNLSPDAPSPKEQLA